MSQRPRLWLAFAGVCALVPACLAQVPSADLWWLLAQGRWIWQNCALPTQEIFSFSASGQTWHNDQWLSSLIFYGLEQHGGLLALHLAKATLLCATFAILLDTGRARITSENSVAEAFLPLIGLGCMWASQKEYFFDVRAYLFTYLLASLWWRWLLLRRPISAPALVLTAWLWANLHAGILIGLGLLLLAKLAGHPHLRTRVLIAAGLITLVNPSGWELHLHVVRLLGSPWGHWLNEWTPLWDNYSNFWTYLLFLSVSLVVLGYSLTRAPEDRWEALCLVAVGALSLTGWRHIVLFCWLSIPPWCNFLSRRLPLQSPGWLRPALLGVLLARAAWSLPGQSPERLSTVNTMFPRWAADFLEANQLGPRLYNPYGCGGYLIWRLYPQYLVAIDGRAAQVYPIEAYLDYLRAANNRDKLLYYVGAYGVDTVLLSCTMAEAGRSLLEGEENWTLIYQDDFFCIFQRRSTVKGDYRYPENPRNRIDQAQAHPDQAMKLVERALQLDPDYAQAYFVRGALSFQQRNFAQGLSDTNRALQLCPTLPNAHLNLAAYYKDHQPDRARDEIAKELKNYPDNPQALELRRLLDRSLRP